MGKNKTLLIHTDIYIGVLLAAIGLFLYSKTNDMISTAPLFPRIALTVFIGLSVLLLIKGIRESIATLKAEQPKDVKLIKWNEIKIPLLVYLIITIYVVAIKLIGFFIASALFMLGLMLFYRQWSWKILLFTTTGVSIFIYVLFVLVLKINLP